MSNKPAFKNKYVTVWDGDYGKTFVVEKSYKDKKTDEWKRSNKFFENEMPALLEALKEAMQSRSEVVQEDTNDFSDEEIPF